MPWEFAINGRLLSPEQAASFIPGPERNSTRMSTPTVQVVASAPPLTANHLGYAAKLQAEREIAQAAETVSRLPRNIKSTPRKLVEFLRLDKAYGFVKNGAGSVGNWISKAAAPAAGFFQTVGLIPSGVLLATGDRGQAAIRWVARSVWGLFSWTMRKVGSLLDRSVRIFGRPGNWLADKMLAGTTKVLNTLAKPVGATYVLSAPLVSSKSGHIKLVNRLARVVVVHRVIRMFVRNPFIAWPLELFIDLVVIGRAERALQRGAGVAADFKAGFKDGKAEAAAQAAVDAHIAREAAQNAKQTVNETVVAGRGATIPESMEKIGEVVESLGKKTDEFLAAQASPTVAASPGVVSNDTERSDGQEGGRGSETVDDQLGQPVETVDELKVRLEAEGKIGQIMVPADTTREEQLDAAQHAADKIGEDVVAVLPDGSSVVVEPTGTVVETVMEADGPEMDDAPVSREARRAVEREHGRQSAKGKASSGRRR